MSAEPTINNPLSTNNYKQLLIRSYKLLAASRQSFTLIELLVAVALIAVLAVAVIMSLNPQELIKQSRDSTRLSDLQNLNKSLSWFEADTGGIGFMGSSSVIYVSIPDTTSTCANLGLPTPPSGYSYRCVTAQNLQKTDGSGWIPVNFNQISFGKTLTKLPIDPINQTSTGNYYTYVPGGSWEITTILESQKYSPQAINDGDAFPGVYSLRTSPNPLTPGLRDKGLVGYWSFDEGSGTTAYDRSGNNNNGILTNGPTWTQGKVGQALSFDGVNDYVQMPFIDTFNQHSFSVGFWVNWNVANTNSFIIYTCDSGNMDRCLPIGRRNDNQYTFAFYSDDFNNVFSPNLNTWYFVFNTWDPQTKLQKVYVNGNLVGTRTSGGLLQVTSGSLSGGLRVGTYAGYYHSGNIDDLRIYNRVLSEAEIQAIYNATK